MPVTQRGNSFQATVHHKGERFRQTFPTHREAAEWEEQTKTALKNGEIIQDPETGSNLGPRTLRQLLDMTHKKYWAGTSGEEAALINANKCLAYLGEDRPPSSINETIIDNMVFQFQTEGKSPATINRRLSALSRMLSFAFDRGYIRRKPKIDRQKEPDHRVRFITPEEEAETLSFLQFIGEPDMVDLVAFGIDTGMRLSEILRVSPKDIHDGLVVIGGVNRKTRKTTSKNGKIRSVPLTDRAAGIVARRSEGTHGKLWAGWTNDKIRHHWNHARRHLGLLEDEEFVPHTMRHTFCSRLVQRGVDLLTVSQLAGHTSITTTMRYAHLRPKNLIDAIKLLNPQAELETV